MNTAMILAAGRGERLKPLTNYIPKAMCLIKGKPLIEHHVIKLAEEGFKRIIINHAYLGEQIRHYLGNGQRYGITIDYSPEPPGGLETGGGLQNALTLLGPEPFLAVNADIYTNFKFGCLQLPEHSLMHLVLGDNLIYKTKRDFGLNELNQLTNTPCYTNLGIVVYHPHAFKNLSVGRYSVVPLMRKLIHSQQISGELFNGLWIDVGTPERLAYAQTL